MIRPRTILLALLAAVLLCAGIVLRGVQPVQSASAAPTAPPAQKASAAKGTFTFSTVDRRGKSVDESVFDGYRLIMINFWEPWCGPCVQEMPDLEKLYEKYMDEGLLILGVYSEDRMEEEVNRILVNSGTSYPILLYTEDFKSLTTQYVPTTVFLDGGGRLVEGPVVGGRSFDAWEKLVTAKLN